MSAKLVKVYLAEPVHRWIKTLAAWHHQEIGQYVGDLVKIHMPKDLKFSERPPAKKNSKSTEASE
jgi:hypothetical protein